MSKFTHHVKLNVIFLFQRSRSNWSELTRTYFFVHSARLHAFGAVFYII